MATWYDKAYKTSNTTSSRNTTSYGGPYGGPHSGPPYGGGFMSNNKVNEKSINTSNVSSGSEHLSYKSNKSANNTNVSTGSEHLAYKSTPSVKNTTWGSMPNKGQSVYNTTWGNMADNQSGANIIVHNNDGDKNSGNPHKGETVFDFKFGTVTTKNNTLLNTEDDEVMEVWEKVNKLKRLNPTWTDIEAANYLNYGTTDRKYNGTRGKTVNAGSEDMLKDGLMNTWGMGIRGDYNFGKAMDVGSYSNGLDWVSSNANQMSAEDIKIQRAILDSTKKFKKPSKFGEFFKDIPSLLNAAAQLKNIQPTRESFDTEIGSVGWDNLAIRQLERIELMPDGSSPYDYLKNHQNEDYNKLANKYSMVKSDEYKPMTWWKERNLSPEEADMSYEENLVGVNENLDDFDPKNVDGSSMLQQRLNQELQNNGINVVDGIKVDGDIVKLNESFQKGPHLNSNDNEIKESVYNYSNNTYNDKTSDEVENTDKSKETAKYTDPASRAGGFESLFGIPYAPLINIEPEDTKIHLENNTVAGKSYTWDSARGKYRVFDESKGLSYITPDEARLELDL